MKNGSSCSTGYSPCTQPNSARFTGQPSPNFIRWAQALVDDDVARGAIEGQERIFALISFGCARTEALP